MLCQISSRVGDRVQESSGTLGLGNQEGEWKETQTKKFWWLNPEDELLAQKAMEILEETSLSPEVSIIS